MSNKKKTVKAVDFGSANIGFIGAGRMTESLLNGLINYGKVEATRLHVSAPTTNNLQRLKQQYPGIHITKSNYDIFGKYKCDIVFIAVYGSVIHELYKKGGSRPSALATNYIPNLKKPLYVLSLVTGYTLKQIRECLLNPDHPDRYMIEMHRIVINCACAYGMGICAIDVEPDSKKLAEPVRTMLSSISKLEYIPEKQMDGACALVGSGLAFSYYLIQVLSEGAVKAGLGQEIAQKYTAKVVSSAALSVLESGKDPTELQNEAVTSGGPAASGLDILNRDTVNAGVSDAVNRAHGRAAALAEHGPGGKKPEPKQ